MIETLQSIQAIGYARVTAATFGHLAPKPQTESGWILFTLTAWGETTLIDFDFDNLEASPWFNDDAIEYLYNYTSNYKEKNFGVFKWEGTYKKFKNGNSKFKGKFKEIECIK